MTRISGWAALTTALVISTGCLVKDSRHTWYLEPDGSVRWVTLEQYVRSDAGDPAERDREERRYLDAARRHASSAAEDLATLGATEISTQILRDRVPYAVLIQGRFASLEQLGLGLLDQMSGTGRSRIQVDGEIREWAFEVPSPRFPDDLDFSCGPEDLRVVLATGRFVAAEHFTLSADGRVATCRPDSETEPANEQRPDMRVLKLRWTTSLEQP